MAEVINILDAVAEHPRRARGWHMPHDPAAMPKPYPTEAGGQPRVTRENVFRAILLLDLAVQRMRVLLREIADPERKSAFEAQVVVVEQSLQHARDLALKL